jgi:hypothetical protein
MTGKGRTWVPLWALGAVLLADPSGARAQDVEVAYTGRLEQDAGPVNGPVDMQFRAFRVESGGTEVWTQSMGAVMVRAGEFHVTLAFPPAVLANSEVWLAVSVKPVGAPAYVPLGGRQRLLYVPYAARAENFSVGNAINMDARMGQRINLWDDTFGLGIESATLFYRAHQVHKWYLGGTAGAGGGIEAMRLRNTGTSTVLRVNGTESTVHLRDTNNTTSYFLHVNDGRFNVLADTNGDDVWDGAIPLRLENGKGYVYGRLLRATETVVTDCATASCTASCPSGLVIRQAIGFHGVSARADIPLSAWACGTAQHWMGSCIGASSCTVSTGCTSSSLHMICELP